MDFAQGNIVGIFFRTFFYGVYLLILAHGLRWIFFEDEGWRIRPRINTLMLSAIMATFLSITGSLVIWLVMVFVAIRGTRLSNQYILVGFILENMTTLMIDAVLIFRCWVVSNRSWPVICFPLVLWLANIGLFVSFACKTAMDATGYTLILGVFFSCNIAINVYATSSIIYQILRVARKQASDSTSDLYEICRMIVECGLPYLFTSIFSLVVAVIGMESYLFPTGCALGSTINGITFNILLIRVGLRRIDSKRNDGLWSKPVSILRFNVVAHEHDQLEDSQLDYSGKRRGERV